MSDTKPTPKKPRRKIPKSDICGAKKRDKSPCRAKPMENGRCRLHGGKTPKGFASPHFKHGRTSKYLPKGLADTAAEFAADPVLLELREAIAVQDVRLTELYKELGEREPVEVWIRLRHEFEDWQRLERERDELPEFCDTPKQQKKADARRRDLQLMIANAKQSFTMLLQNGCATEEKHAIVWDKIEQSVEVRRKLTDTEAKRIKDTAAFVPREQFQAFILWFSKLVLEYVPDADSRNAIATKLISAGNLGSGEPDSRS